jgi:SAM-dependent methyltransferase
MDRPAVPDYWNHNVHYLPLILAAVPHVERDFLTEPYRPGSFDFICSMAAVHHMNFTAALTRMRQLTRPGGCVAVVGLARDATPADLARSTAAVPANWLLRAIRGQSDPGVSRRAEVMRWAGFSGGAGVTRRGRRRRRRRCRR